MIQVTIPMIGLKSGDFRQTPWFSLFFILLLYCKFTLAADCAAFAEPGEITGITSKGLNISSFEIRGKPCKSGCGGNLRYKVHYEARDGELYYDVFSLKWRSNRGEPILISQKNNFDLCAVGEHSLGPCRLVHVEVERVSCHLNF